MHHERELMRRALREAFEQHAYSDSELDEICQSFEKILQNAPVQGEPVQDMGLRASMAVEVRSAVQAAIAKYNSKR